MWRIAGKHSTHGFEGKWPDDQLHSNRTATHSHGTDDYVNGGVEIKQ